MMRDFDTPTAAVRASASRFGGKPCLISPTRTVSFQEFAADIIALTRHFGDIGVRPGDRVAILDIDSIDYLEVLYALATMGAIAVPLNYRQRLGELQYQIRNSGAKLLLANRRYTAEADGLAPDLALGWQPIDAFCTEAFRNHGGDAGDLTGVDCQSPFAICYTSGTTGRPKGAVISQRAACLRATKLMLEFGLRADDVMHVMTPLFHISGLIVTLIGIMRGATVLILPQFNLDSSMRAVREHGVTFVCLVPTMLAMMRNAPDFGPDYFGRLRLIMYAGSPMNPRLLRDAIAVYSGDFVQSFG